MRIAHVDAETGFSGGEVQVFLLMEGLRERGHDNLLVCPPGSAAEREAVSRGFDVARVPMRNDLDLGAVLVLRRELARAHVDLVHLHTGRATWLGGLAARLARLPALSTRRMDRRVRPGWTTRALYGRLVSRVAAISPAVAERLRAGGVREDELVLIRSSIDPSALVSRTPREEIRRDLGAHERTVLLLTLVRLVPRKGIDVLLSAFARLGSESPMLAIAGDGPERARLEERARALGIAGRARFLGERADKAELLAACDVFVLPSRAEGLGVAALEAMAAARPVVATRVGGLADLVLDGTTGMLVPPDDCAALATAIERMCSDAGLRERMGRAGRARLNDGFLAEQMVASYERLYGEVLAAAARPVGAGR